MSWMWWLAAPLAIGAFGILLLLTGFGQLFGGRVGRASGHFLSGAPMAVVGLAAGLLGLNTQTYSRLSHEGPVAEVMVKATDPANSRYLVTVHRTDGSNETLTCNLQGDEWVLSGRVQKWKPWANVLGLDATYSLDQMSNMYFTAARASGKPITSCDLDGPAPAVDQYIPPGWLAWLADQSYSTDRRFGSANYMPLADGAAYKVVITQSGFNAEPDNDAARTANDKRG
jgi:hypothetical protein